MSSTAPGPEQRDLAGPEALERRLRYVVTVDRVETGPEDLAVQLPTVARALRRLPGLDRPDYTLAALRHPLRLRTTVDDLGDAGVDVASTDARTTTVHDDGTVVGLVYGLVLAPRSEGVVLARATGPVEVATALVLDPSQMTDRSLHLEKVYYVAVTSVTVSRVT